LRDFNDDVPTGRILTVGYEKSDLRSYIKRLQDACVDVLVDVRDRPISRKKGFSKKALAEAVSSAGIKYVHVQDLGDPKPGRDAARAGEMEAFRTIFGEHMKSPNAQAALADLALDLAGRRICLTCFERDHHSCHRSIVAEQLSKLTGAPIHHLKI